MKSALSIIAIAALLYGCGNTNAVTGNQSTGGVKVKDTLIKSNKGDEDTGPSAEEVLKETLASYNKIEKNDTIITDDNDILQLHLKYYCLHDSTLIVPALYDWRETPKKDFITHNFAAKITVIKNRDTVFNSVVLKGWFNKVIDESLKKYATIVSSKFERYDKTSKQLIFTFSVSIPTTDVGIGAGLLIDTNGGYQITDKTAALYSAQ